MEQYERLITKEISCEVYSDIDDFLVNLENNKPIDLFVINQNYREKNSFEINGKTYDTKYGLDFGEKIIDVLKGENSPKDFSPYMTTPIVLTHHIINSPSSKFREKHEDVTLCQMLNGRDNEIKNIKTYLELIK